MRARKKPAAESKKVDPNLDRAFIMKAAIIKAEKIWKTLPGKEKKYYNKISKNHLIKSTGQAFFLSICLIFGSAHGEN